MSDEKKSMGSYFTKKVIVGVSAIAALFAIVSGIWAFEFHYASNKRVDTVVFIHEEDVAELRLEVAGAIQKQQLKGDIQFYSMMVEKLTQEKNAIRRLIHQYPNDQGLKDDYRDISEEIKRFKRLLDQAIRKMG